MIQGTTSSAGKSTVATALCRILHRRQVRVAPFKPQNMALNSAVTADGGEIGRAQAVQAEACGLLPLSDMNPVLLKPNTNIGAQVIIQGRVLRDMDARTFHAYKPQAKEAVLQSYFRLSERFDCIIVEGAGSPAEINLRDGDIANMGFAEAIGCPVILVADIDRGGVFAHLVGTMALLSPAEASLVKGFVINRFRGDVSLLQPGLDWLEAHTGKSVLGVLPYMPGLHIEAEDSLSASSPWQGRFDEVVLRVVVPALPRMSNHTDFDALALHGQVDLRFVSAGESVAPADLIILPGSKSVCLDLAWLRQQGFDRAIARHLRYGGKVIGICGGFQMLGQAICDPLALESEQPSCQGLGLLDMATRLEPDKRLCRVEGVLALGGAAVKGYEIHMGVSSGAALRYPAVLLPERSDGALSSDNQILGTYLHGLFDHPQALSALLAWAGLAQPEPVDYLALRDAHIDELADVVERHLDFDLVSRLLHLSPDVLEPSSRQGRQVNRC